MAANIYGNPGNTMLSMCITEYNEEETMQLFKEQGRKEGIGIGEQNRANEMAERMIRAKEPGNKIVLYTGLGRKM